MERDVDIVHYFIRVIELQTIASNYIHPCYPVNTAFPLQLSE